MRNIYNDCFVWSGSPKRGGFLKEPLGKRQHLARFLTSLVPVALEAERKRGDVEILLARAENIAP